eukprot:3499977-Prymnesium_polylepis.1
MLTGVSQGLGPAIRRPPLAPHSVLDSHHAPCGRGRLQRPRASVEWRARMVSCARSRAAKLGM